jgi:hypothetical protein
MRRPQPRHRMRPPDNSKNLRFEFNEERLSLIAMRAPSTTSRGMPESGTGTAIHSELGLFYDLKPIAVDPALWAVLGNLLAYCTLAVEPPNTVRQGLIQPSGNLGSNQCLKLLEGVCFVDIVLYYSSYKGYAP